MREARRRAGLTQAELAERVGTTQSSIARLESGATASSFERVVEVVRACGYDVDARVSDLDDGGTWSQAVRNRTLTPDRRVRNMLRAQRFIASGRRSARRG